MKKSTWVMLVIFPVAALSFACSSAPKPPARLQVQPQGEGVAVGSIPDEYKAEYSLFANRCSKCHSLSRALNNGDHDPPYWQRYVTRMRRQPSSGIAPEDEPPILRFLNFYSAQLRAENAADAGSAQ